MKRLLLVTLFLFAPLAVAAQCEPGAQCVPQETINKCAKIADEVIALRDTVEKFKIERAATDTQLKAANDLISSLQELVKFQAKVMDDSDRVVVMMQKVVDAQNALITKLTAMVNQPKSAWQKFLSAVRDIAVLAMGITIGRGL